MLQELALEAVHKVTVEVGDGSREIDVKKYAKIEKIPGGAIEDCRLVLTTALPVFVGNLSHPGAKSYFKIDACSLPPCCCQSLFSAYKLTVYGTTGNC